MNVKFRLHVARASDS